MKKLIAALALMASFSVVAGSVGAVTPLPWHFNASLGYTNYEGLVNNNVAVQRISGARDLFDFHDVILGIELGVQTGVTSRFTTNQEQLDAFDGSAIQATLNPFFDVLGTAMVPIKLPTQMKPAWGMMEHMSLFTKVGMAYRQMYFDRHTMSPNAAISPEVQVGIGKALSSQATIALAYQGIYASNNNNGLIAQGMSPKLPTQNGALLIFGWNAS